MFDNFFERVYTQFIAGDGIDMMITGLGSTLLLALSALVLGIVLGTVFAVMKVVPANTLPGKILNGIATVYVTVIRGIPLVVLLLLGYFGIFGPRGWDAMPVGIMIFGINSSAYVAEIMRSGIQAVDKGQMEAGRSLGRPTARPWSKLCFRRRSKIFCPRWAMSLSCSSKRPRWPGLSLFLILRGPVGLSFLTTTTHSCPIWCWPWCIWCWC